MMKKIYTILYMLGILLTGMSTIVSCEDKGEQGLSDLSLLQVDGDTLRFIVEGGEAKLNVRTLLTWTATSAEADWCIVKRIGSLLSVSAQTNIGDKRATVVQIEAGGLVRKVIVEQAGVIPGQALQLTKDKLELTCMEQGVVGVKALQAWNIEIPDADTTWCVVKKNPMGGMMITFRGNEEHRTEIAVVSGNERKTVEINQKRYPFTYQVGELYQDDNGEFSGIIFYREGNRIGVISLDEGYTTFMVPGDPDLKKIFGFTTSSAAIKLVKNEYPQDWHSRFPALAWADDLNARYKTTGWYLFHSSDGLLFYHSYPQIRDAAALMKLWGGVAFNDENNWLMTVRERVEEGVFKYQIVTIMGNVQGGVGARGREEKVSCRGVKYVELP